MKKTLAFLLAMVMALSLAACGGNDTKDSSSDKTSSQTETTQEVQETEQTPTEIVLSTEKTNTVELTLDNWQDFFELKYDYLSFKSEDEWGDETGEVTINATYYLGIKDNIKVENIEGGHIAFNCTTKETSLIHFDKNNLEKYTFSDTKAESNEPIQYKEDIYENFYEKHDNYSNPILIKDYKFEIGDVDVIKSEDTENGYTGRVITKLDVEVTRIKGTITYLTAE